ncbi:hypothetical protein AB0N88_00575 [Streptomyces sp. NPDC093516]|uniref:hypothetical protein n=2 Tax=unclassified Streptomyces TaxID=2593676 RepID=UPI00341A2D22
MDFMTRRAVRWLRVTFTVAVGLNLVEAVGDPGGAVWTAVRLAASAAFTLALLACAVLGVLRWRRARGG